MQRGRTTAPGSYTPRVAPGARLRSRLSTGATLLLRELSAFGVVGAACFVLDVTLFQVLYTSVGLGAVTSKVLASAVATTAAFVGHRYWSFSRRVRSGLPREYVLFFGVNGLTLMLSMLMIAAVRYPLGQESALALQVTNVAAIALGTALRFTLYRRWVFLAPAGATSPAVSPRPALAPDALGKHARPVG
jgi:putative flippase GtrA